MDGMKEFPDKFFDLAVVDPPYGDANASDGCGVAWQAEIPPRCTSSGGMSENRTERGVTRTGGTWAKKYAKKSLRGTRHRPKSILMNSFVSHGIKLSGAVITSAFRQQDVF